MLLVTALSGNVPAVRKLLGVFGPWEMMRAVSPWVAPGFPQASKVICPAMFRADGLFKLLHCFNPSSGNAVFDTMGSTLNTLLAVYIGSTLNGLALVAQNNDIVPDDPDGDVAELPDQVGTERRDVHDPG